MDPVVFTVAVSVVAFATGILGTIVANRIVSSTQIRIEDAKWIRKRADMLLKVQLDTLGKLSTKMGVAVLAMTWLCWEAKKSPSWITQERRERYDKEMYGLLPEISGLRVLLAATSPEIGKAVGDIAQEIIVLDEVIASAALLCIPNEPDTAASLAALYDRAMRLERALGTRLSENIAGAGVLRLPDFKGALLGQKE